MASLKSIVLRAGDCVILPKDAVINSMIVNGSITASSDCTLPTPTNYKCGYFFLILDADSNDGHSMDEDTTYVSVTVGASTYIINEPVLVGDPNSPTPTAITALNSHIVDTPIFEFMAITENEVTSRTHIHVYFQVPENLFNTVELKVDNRGIGNYQYYKPIESECEVYDDPA